MKCNICGEEFDPAHLSLVMLHEHNENINPSLAIGIKGKKIDKYYYPNKTEAKEGDICFYSEYDKAHEDPTHYADSIIVIIDIDGELFSETKVYNRFEEEYLLYEDTDSIPIKYGVPQYKKDSNILEDFRKIGEIGKDDYMLTVEYATKNYPLNPH